MSFEQTRQRGPSLEQRALAKSRYAAGESMASIAKSLGLHQTTLKRIAAREFWQGPISTYFQGVQRQNAELAKRPAQARARYEAGEDLNTVAQALALNAVALRRVARVERWSAPMVVCFDEHDEAA